MARTKLEIFQEILTLCQVPTLKYRIICGIHTSYDMCMGYLAELLEKGLLEMKINPHRVYVTTDKGKKLLEQLTETLLLLSSTNKHN